MNLSHFLEKEETGQETQIMKVFLDKPIKFNLFIY